MANHVQSFDAISNTMLTVTVREQERSFTSHLDVICGVSSYFTKRLKGRQDANLNAITLDDVRPAVWITFLDWAYGRQTIDDLYSADREFEEHRVHLTELYIFADKYDVPALRQHIVDYFFVDLKAYQDEEADTFWRPTPIPKCIELAFRSLSSTSPLCRLFVDRFCVNFLNNITDNDNQQMFEREDLPLEFCMGVIHRHAHLRHAMIEGNMEVDYELNLGDYHEHGPDEDISKCSCQDTHDEDYYEESYYDGSYYDGF
ncbi:hypothetical protein BDV96DRAFT_597552 [Lophiotrema nucula]|uniref:BTB domain-containing protein n=1 Tax=Lophiotrema nucula TaxID=690887 RepID=A0A6A5ZEL9_9PLEO|nr:hypothetical protein BDV96DRAFT_597552 [Lophiotrema nucula]